MKFFILNILFFLTFSFVFSQNNGLEGFIGNSINEIPYSTKEAEFKSQEYTDSAIKSSSVNLLKAKEYSLMSLRLAYKSKNDTLLLRTSRTTGVLYSMLKDKDSALFFSKIALYYSNKTKNYKNSAIINTLVANSFIGIGEYDSAYNYFENSEQLYKELNDSAIESSYFFFKLNKASLFKELTLYNLMLKELFEAKHIADSVSDTNFLPQLLGSIAIGYKESGDVDKAILYSKEAINYLKNGEQDKVIIYTNIGNFFSILKEVDSALLYYNKAQDICDKLNLGIISKQDIVLAKSEMFLTHNKNYNANQLIDIIEEEELTNNQKARFYSIKSSLADVINYKLYFAKKVVKYAEEADNIVILKEGYYLLYKLQKESNDINNALINYEHYNKLADSIFNQDKSKAIQKVIVQKVIDDKNSEIALKELNFKKVKAEKEKFILIILLALVFSVLILISIFYKLKSQKQKTIIARQEKEILNKENQEIKNELINISLEAEKHIDFLKETKDELKEIKLSTNKESKINSLFAKANQFVISENDKKEYQDKIQEIKEDFFEKLNEKAKLTKTEKKLAALLRLNLTSKEIAEILKVSESTVEVYRSRLRKKLSIDKEVSLVDYFNLL